MRGAAFCLVLVIAAAAFLWTAHPALPVAPSLAYLPVLHVDATPTLTPTVTPSPTATRATAYELRITSLQYKGRDEYVQITNMEPLTSVVLTGWHIVNLERTHRYDFPYGFVLPAGAWVRVHSGPDAFENRPTDLEWTRAYMWRDSGGAAILCDSQARQVSTWGY